VDGVDRDAGAEVPGVCQVFCVNDLDFVLGFGFVVALGFAAPYIGSKDFPMPRKTHKESCRAAAS
jgi:hypothetical protein